MKKWKCHWRGSDDYKSPSIIFEYMKNECENVRLRNLEMWEFWEAEMQSKGMDYISQTTTFRFLGIYFSIIEASCGFCVVKPSGWKMSAFWKGSKRKTGQVLGNKTDKREGGKSKAKRISHLESIFLSTVLRELVDCSNIVIWIWKL